MRLSARFCLMGSVVALTALPLSLCLNGCSADEAPGSNASAAKEAVTEAQSLSDNASDLSSQEDAAQRVDAAPLHDSLAQIAQSYSGSFGIACAVADGSWSTDVNGDERLVSASVIKLAILGTLLDQAHQGALSLDDQVTVASSDLVGGTGVIQGFGAGSSYAYRELAGYMIQDSDNVATNLIIDAVGMPAVNDFAASIGMTATQLNRRMMDFSSDAENYTSANDVARILEMIWEGRLVDADSSAFALDLLKGQHDTTGLLEGLPAGTGFAHKTGWLDNVVNDGGIVVSDTPYVLVVLSNDAGDAQAQNCMTEIAQTADAWVGGL